MFYQKEIISEMSKNRKNGEYEYFLLTSHIKRGRELSKFDFLVLCEKWKSEMKKFIEGEEGAAYLINRGNIFVIIKKEKKEKFIRDLKNFSYSKDEKAIIICDYLILQEKETDMLLS